MTLSTQTTKVTVLGNGAQSVFTYSFLLPTAGQYALYYTDADGLISLVSQANYTVSGIGVATGGTFTYLPSGVPIATGTSLTLVRAVPNTQIYEFGNQGAYYPQQVEGALDRLDMQVQQLQTLANLSFRVPFTNANVADVPTLVDRRSKYAGFDADGNLTALNNAPTPEAVGAFQINGDQSLEAQPTGNPVDTLSSLIVTGTTVSEVEREFLVSIGFTSNKGSGASSPERDKVALYAGMIADSGTGDAWSFNTVLSLFPGAASYNALGYELDFNNLNGHRGDAPGAAGLTAPVGYGLAITGVASYRSTSAILVTSPGSAWNRGLTFTSGVVQSSIQDVSTAERALDLRGSYDYAIDVSESVNAEAAIQMGWGQKLRGRTSADANIQLIGVSASDQVVVGDNGVPVVVAGTSLVPNVDNTIPFGSGSFRWTEIFAANGTINTSDARQKDDMKALPSMTALLREVQPISFKFKQGGADIETVTEQRLLPVYENVDVERERTVVGEDGKARVVKVQEVVRRKVYDEVPVVDADGKQIIDWSKPVRGAGGLVLRPAMPVPRVHLVPRMAMQDVEAQKVTPRPGKRHHYGFAAGDIAKALKKLNLGDIGVFVESDGVEGLRTDQLVAALWQVAREQDAEIAAIKAFLVI